MKFWKLLSNACAHLSIVGSLMLLTFYVTDRFNSAMAFIDHDMTKGLVFILSLITLICVGGLFFDRNQGALALRVALGGAAGLSALTAVTLLVLDHSMVERFEADLSNVAPLLFTNDYTKAALALLAVTSIAAALLLIVLRRRAAGREA